ncbi:MAG: ribonuclease H-like domain-containing protein [Candidatus Eremiobacterota bacterium]
MNNFYVEKNSRNANIFLVKSMDGETYTVTVSDDLFESHKCTCRNYKKEGDCVHIQSVVEKLNRGEKIEEQIIYLDVETQFLAEDVGGWGNVEKMKVAIVVIYSSREDEFYHYREEDIPSLIDKLKEASLIVGFNIKKFDYRVIQPYVENFSLLSLPTFDMLEEIYKKLGHRISLNELAKSTLNIEKSADGLQSVEWFKNGDMDKIIEYCKKDVIITRDLFLHLRKYGALKFYDRRSNRMKSISL